MSEFALDGLKQVMAVKSRVVLPYLVPKVCPLGKFSVKAPLRHCTVGIRRLLGRIPHCMEELPLAGLDGHWEDPCGDTVVLLLLPTS